MVLSVFLDRQCLLYGNSPSSCVIVCLGICTVTPDIMVGGVAGMDRCAIIGWILNYYFAKWIEETRTRVDIWGNNTFTVDIL